MPAWAEITAEATRSLKHFLAARKLIEVTGPLGWTASSVELGPRGGHRGTGGRGGGRSAPGPVPGRAAHPLRAGPRPPRRRRARRRRPRSGRGGRRRPGGRPGRGHRRLPRLRRRRAGRPGRVQPPRPHRHRRGLRRLPPQRGPGGGRAAGRRRGRSVRHRPGSPLLHRRHRDDRARRLPGVRSPEDDPGRARWCGPRPSTAPWCSASEVATSSWSSARTSPWATGVSPTPPAQLYLEESLAVRINSPEAAVRLAYPWPTAGRLAPSGSGLPFGPATHIVVGRPGAPVDGRCAS